MTFMVVIPSFCPPTVAKLLPSKVESVSPSIGSMLGGATVPKLGWRGRWCWGRVGVGKKQFGLFIYIYTYTHIIIVFKDIPKNIYIHIYDYIGFVLVEHGGTIDLGNHGNLWEIEKVNDGTSIYWHCIIYAYIYIYIWVNY